MPPKKNPHQGEELGNECPELPPFGHLYSRVGHFWTDLSENWPFTTVMAADLISEETATTLTQPHQLAFAAALLEKKCEGFLLRTLLK
jgi:hypothetical protein